MLRTIAGHFDSATAATVAARYGPERKIMGKSEYGRDYNFCPGPCILPEAVMEEAGREFMNWKGSGTSINEMSHRGPEFSNIAREAEADIRTLLEIPNNFKVLFL
jgi:phosphoserine aminotransferase